MPIQKNELIPFLKRTAIMSIAVNSDTYPISSVVLFAVDDDFIFYFTTHVSSNKAKALRKDPHISFSIWEHKQMLIQGSGITEEVTGQISINTVLDKLALSSVEVKNFWPPLLQLEPDSYVVYKILPKQMQVLSLQEATITNTYLSMQPIQL